MLDKEHSLSKDSSNSSKAWFWFFFGIVIGFSLFTLSFVFIADHDKKSALAVVEQQIANLRRPRQAEAPEKAGQLDLKKYQFYKSLTQRAQDIFSGDERQNMPPSPVEIIRHTRKQANLPEVKGVQKTPTGFILQVGAFRRQEEADRLRANLTLMGLPCYVQPAKVKNQTYHRVRLGPFDSKKELSKVQAKLRKKHIESIAMTLY